MMTDTLSFSKYILTRLTKLGITRLYDLVLHLPLRYLDKTHITAIGDLRIGDHAQVEGTIRHAEVYTKPRRALIIQLEDTQGVLVLRFLHFYPSLLHSLREGERILAYGEVRQGYWGLEMVHPELGTTDKRIAQTLTPIYPTVNGLTQAQISQVIDKALQSCDLGETLPSDVYQITQTYTLPSFSQSVRMLHHPSPALSPSTMQQTAYWKRLAFDELLAQQLALRRHYAHKRREPAICFPPSQKLVPALLENLSFRLTKAQQKVTAEISHDLNTPHPMQRLLQGDVGSGKTIVACLSALQCIESNWQVALMAPTEILAEQHYYKMLAWFAPLNLQVVWLTGRQARGTRATTLKMIADGSAHLVIGTHALFQKAVVFKQLGLCIVDEQHRFGVEQRLALRQKGQPEPHQLMMSATPIPRTLSMSYYADLDLSVIDELPQGRKPVITKLVADKRRDEVLERVYAFCQQGGQAYWVCPLIDESEVLHLQTMTDLYQQLQQRFPQLKLGLIHGKMKSIEKQDVMREFSSGNLQLLIATTVVEVGLDVPHASLMVIEHAERMGLSQLHQLRGRVGRGTHQATCLLLYQTPLSNIARARLHAIHQSHDGFEIAQTDLKLRGPGELLGVRQSGVPLLKIADLERDADLLNLAKARVPYLLGKHATAVSCHLNRWIPQVEQILNV